MDNDSVEYGETHHPLWEGAVVGFLGAFELGLIPRDQTTLAMASQLIKELLDTDMLPDMGTLQEYLEAQGSVMQLTAMPTDTQPLPPEYACVNPVTNEPATHWLCVSLGEDDLQGRRQREIANLTSEDNIERLRTDTGLVTLPFRLN